jgi:hypothetical protein
MDNETPYGVSDEWSTIPWRKLERYIYRLQKRIYNASSPPIQSTRSRLRG